ncbi:hypothetical protein KC901_02240 [Patescibacteria group bacterium]|nr:hypothetical protein [Patescibacteria group bacterium]
MNIYVLSRGSRFATSFFIAFSLFIPSISFAALPPVYRSHDPIVLSGAVLDQFYETDPDMIVGFKYDGGWQQIPVQIDERDERDIASPYGAGAGVYRWTYPTDPSNPTALFYTDENTEIGADTDTYFDSNDELAFMVSDLGSRATSTFPDNVDTETCLEIQVDDYYQRGRSYLYLCRSSILDPDAGDDYVTLTSDLTGTAGFPHNDDGTTNDENTTVSTDAYDWHYRAEWIGDEFTIDGTDVLDTYDIIINQNGTPTCLRNVATYSSGENAFIAVKDGPVRVIRSFMGTNSGSLTYRTHIFYQNRQDVITVSKVHDFAPSSVSYYDVFDYNSDADGMTYRNSRQPYGDSAVVIDGVADVLNQDDETLLWESVAGSVGTISHIYRYETNGTSANFLFPFYYQDDATTPDYTCGVGDDEAWGTSGFGLTFVGDTCTDPLHGSCTLKDFESTRITYVDDENDTDASLAETYNAFASNPLSVSISSYQTNTRVGSYRRHTCKDPSAANYDRFGIHDASLCNYVISSATNTSESERYAYLINMIETLTKRLQELLNR